VVQSILQHLSTPQLENTMKHPNLTVEELDEMGLSALQVVAQQMGIGPRQPRGKLLKAIKEAKEGTSFDTQLENTMNANETTNTTTEQAAGDAAADATVKAEAKKARKTPAKKAAKKSAAKTPAKKAAKAKRSHAKVPSNGLTGPAVLKAYAPQYHKDNETKTSGGNPSVDNDDEVAQKLRGKDLDAVYGVVAKALKTKDQTAEAVEKELRARYKGLNVGMQRMNLGNRFRAALKA
jgi:hypothetical protein